MSRSGRSLKIVNKEENKKERERRYLSSAGWGLQNDNTLFEVQGRLVYKDLFGFFR